MGKDTPLAEVTQKVNIGRIHREAGTISQIAMEMPQIPNVLLVEDAPELAMLYQDYLRNEPINLEHVDTGRAAMAKVETAPPQAMLLDLRLPDMDGADVLERVIQTNLPTGVLIMTAYGDVDDAVQSIRAGASDFLTNPF